MTWTDFYAALYQRVDAYDAEHGQQPVLHNYLPRVLDELRYGPAAAWEPRHQPNPEVFWQAADAAVEANQRIYAEAIGLRKFAEFASNSYNPWTEAPQ
jgi:hypothetical protein